MRTGDFQAPNIPVYSGGQRFAPHHDTGISKLFLCGRLYMCMCVCVCVCVCVFARAGVRAGVCPAPRLYNWWCDMNFIRLVKQVLQLLFGNSSVVVIVNGRSLGIGTCRRH